jgi:uncharacterized protein YecE (DUF72 family)
MIEVGVAGWAYDDWEGRVYPRPRPRGFDPLAWLARAIDLVEVNATFYAPVRAATTASWLRRVEPFPRFAFVVKAHQSFTHAEVPDEGLEREWRAGVSPLEASGRLRGFLAQFPLSFRPSEAAFGRLERLRERLGDATLVLELRHRGWFEPEWLQRLAPLGAGLAHLDLPPHRDHPPPDHASPGPLGYLRLHGRNAAAWFDPRAGRDARYDHRYAPDEVADLAERARRIAASAERTLVVANNHYGGKAVAVALELRFALEGGPVFVPPPLLETFPDLSRIALPQAPAGQLEMFS